MSAKIYKVSLMILVLVLLFAALTAFTLAFSNPEAALPDPRLVSPCGRGREFKALARGGRGREFRVQTSEVSDGSASQIVFDWDVPMFPLGGPWRRYVEI